MKNNYSRRDILKTSGRVLGAGLATIVLGCKTTGGFNSGNGGYPIAQVHDFKIKKVDQNDSPYDLHEVVILGKEYLMQHVNPKGKDTMNIGFFRRRNAVSRLDLISKEVKLRSEDNLLYIPTKVKNKGNNYMDEIILGPNTIDIAERDELKRERKIQASGLYDMKLNEDDATFKLKTIDLPKLGEYFIVEVSKNKRHEGQLPFYLIPVQDSQLDEYYSDGRLGILNQDSIYRPVKWKIEYPKDKDKEDIPTAVNILHTR
jgi:hypothetical protein|tara:strand:- start:597 stop:1373 length:777 start_codon:yes stop_codon:yes gene_type:complete